MSDQLLKTETPGVLCHRLSLTKLRSGNPESQNGEGNKPYQIKLQCFETTDHGRQQQMTAS